MFKEAKPEFDFQNIQRENFIAAGSKGQTWIVYSDKGQPDFIAKGKEDFVEKDVAETLSGTYHPSLPRCFGLHELTSIAKTCYVFEYVEGVCLRDYKIKEINAGLRLFSHLFSLLIFMQTMFAEPLMHLDIKPENIVVKTNGLPVLIDFGSACFDNKRLLTCTHNYAAPEHRAGKPCPASDVYSLALVFLEKITGLSPSKLTELSAVSLERYLLPQLAITMRKCLLSDPDVRPAADEINALLQKELEDTNSATSKNEITQAPVVLKQPRIICIWQSAEMACELAAFLSSRNKKVLLIDTNWLDSRTDILLSSAKIDKKSMASTLTRYLDNALLAASEDSLNKEKLEELIGPSMEQKPALLSPSGRYDFYEKDLVAPFSKLVEQAASDFDFVLLAAGQIIYDDLTCLSLVLADIVLIALAANTADLRYVGRMLTFIKLHQISDASKFWYAIFNYHKEYQLSIGSLKEICKEHLLDPISACAKRQKSYDSSLPYAFKLSKTNQQEYSELCKKLNIII